MNQMREELEIAEYLSLELGMLCANIASFSCSHHILMG